MKQAFTFLVVFLLFNSCTSLSAFKLYERNGKLMGILPLSEGKVVYKRRFDSVELPKEEVFRRSRRWCIMVYRSAKDVLQLVDKETGEIIGKGNSTVYFNVNGIGTSSRLVYHTIAIDVSDDWFDVTISGLEAYRPASGSGLYYVPESRTPIELYNLGSERNIIAFFEAVDTDLNETLLSIQKYVKKPTP